MRGVSPLGSWRVKLGSYRVKLAPSLERKVTTSVWPLFAATCIAVFTFPCKHQGSNRAAQSITNV